MTTKTKKLATLLAVAVVLSSGAYALGTQTGDGGALASSSSGVREHGRQRRRGTTNVVATGSAPHRGVPRRAGPAPGSPSSPRSSA